MKKNLLFHRVDWKRLLQAAKEVIEQENIENGH